MTPEEILNKVENVYSELATSSRDTALDVHDLPFVSATMARWEQLRDDVAMLLFSLKRQHTSARLEYEGALRRSVERASTLLQAPTYEERKLKWEATHMELLRKVEAADFLVTSLTDVQWHLDKKIRWLNGLLIHARELDKRTFYQSSKDTFTLD